MRARRQRAHRRSDELQLAGRTFIVTGGASGIGLSTVEALTQKGSSVTVADINPELVASLGQGIPAVCGDVARPDVAEEVLNRALLASGQIDGVVFAAGSSAVGSIAEVEGKEFERAVLGNLTVHLSLSQAILRFKARNRDCHQCSLVYIASKQAVAPTSGFGGYPVAKGGLLQLARLVAIEGGNVGIRANTVNPGAIFDGSRFWSDRLLIEKSQDHNISIDELPKYYADRTLLGVRVTADDVANVVMFLLSPLSRAITGAVIGVDGGLAVSFAR